MSIRTILIVDDSATDRHFLSEILRQGGYEVIASESGEDSITKARSLHPDLILMDVVMPGMSGYQATRAISRDEKTCDIPVIICTSKGQPTDRVWGLRQGARDYIVKPVQREELLTKIRKVAAGS
jgi:twitching motility two-component system response regulator PilH